MKVNSSSINQSLAGELNKKDKVTKSGNGIEGVADKASNGMIESSARVNISDKAKELSRVKELANQAPDVDAEKVAKFRSLIQSGDYQVNAEAIADKMLGEELQLAATQNN